MTMDKLSARSSFGKMNGKAGGIAGGISRLITKTPALICLLGLLVLMLVMFRSTGDLGGFRQHMTRLQEVEGGGGGAEEEPEFTRSTLASNLPDNSLKSLKELVKEAMDKGLVIIVNATKADADQLYADNPRGALPQWDVNAALDGPTGEILTEVIQELHNMEELQKEVAILRAMQNKCATTQNQADEACAATRLKMLNESKTPEQHIVSAAAGTIFQGDYKFRPIGLSRSPLILFSSYRFSHEEFVLVTLLANSFGEQMRVQETATGECFWMQWDPSSDQSTPPPFPSPVHNQVPVQHGNTCYTFIGDPTNREGLPYNVAIIKCAFQDPAGSNAFGGHLYLKLGRGEFVPVFDEPPEAINHIQFEGALKHKYAFCTPVIWEPLNARYLKQWLMFNHYVFREGKLHYFIYHGIELDSATMSVLQPFLDEGLLTFIDMSLNESFVVDPGQYPSHDLALNDCLQRSRFFADWAFFWGFDEYLEILPPQSLSGILESNKESPYITFGSQIWSSLYCSPLKNTTFGTVDEDWAVDRMFLRLEHPQGGHKWAANPRIVYAGTIHDTREPSWGGINLDTSIARLNLYNSGDSKSPIDVGSDNINCCIILDPEKVNASTAVDGYWWRDTSISATSHHAHDLAKASPLFNFKFASSSNTMAAAGEDHSQNVTQ